MIARYRFLEGIKTNGGQWGAYSAVNSGTWLEEVVIGVDFVSINKSDNIRIFK